MVKKDLAHFDEVRAACAALEARGLLPTPHVPACRFANLAEADATLDALSAAGERCDTQNSRALLVSRPERRRSSSTRAARSPQQQHECRCATLAPPQQHVCRCAVALGRASSPRPALGGRRRHDLSAGWERYVRARAAGRLRFRRPGARRGCSFGRRAPAGPEARRSRRPPRGPPRAGE
eukprot:7385035-Prymnesium_polylepis.2